MCGWLLTLQRADSESEPLPEGKTNFQRNLQARAAIQGRRDE